MKRTSGTATTDYPYHAPTTKQLATLRQLEPLPVRVHTWRLSNQWFEQRNRQTALEFARITGCVSFNLRYPSEWPRAIELAKVTHAKLTAQWLPYHWWARPHWREPYGWLIDQGLLAERCIGLSRLLYGAGLELYLFAIDHETYVLPAFHDEMDVEKNILATSKGQVADLLQAVDDIVRRYFPRARVPWYGAPHGKHGQGVVGPEVESYCTSLYRVWDRENTRAYFFMSYGCAALLYKSGYRQMPSQVPYVALGSAFDRDNQWCDSYNWIVKRSWDCGRFLTHNERSGCISDIGLYPEPGRSEHFWEHLIAWCRGLVS